MQKVVAFLEAHVEWFALGIAAAFLGWTIYSYLIVDPVARKLEGIDVNPGTVDSIIDQHAAERLREKMDPNNATVPNFSVPDFTQSFQQKIGLDGLQPPQLAGLDFDYAPFDVSAMPGSTENAGAPVDHLPTLPVPQPMLTAAALDTLSPAQNQNGGAAPQGAAPAAGKDVRLVVAAFTIPFNEIYNQWNSAFGSAQPGQKPRLAPADFQILAITAYRSELVNDKWTKDQQIEILNGADLPPYPNANDKNAQGTYRESLSKLGKSLVAPDFPQVSAGVVWKDPILYLPGASGTNGQPQPPAEGGAMIPPQPFRTIQTQNRGGGGRGPGGYGGGGFGGPPGFGPGQIPPRPQQQPSEETPAQPAQPPPPIPPAPGTVDAVVQLASPTAPAQLPVEPVSKLNPTAMEPKSPDLCVYIIDDTAQAGKTYRYSISYKALNPVWQIPPTRVSAKGQAWVNQFDLQSKVSSYSPQITVPTQTYFFCGSGPVANKSSFPFEIFTWTGGKWLKDLFNASIGDPIGGVDGGIDYSTGWTYADMRSLKANTQRLVTLVDQDGNISIRDAAMDSTSDDYKKAAQWVEQSKNGTNQPMMQPQFGIPGGAMPGGAPPPGAGQPQEPPGPPEQ